MNYANLFNLIFTLRIFNYLSMKRKTEKHLVALNRDLKRAQDSLEISHSVRSIESLNIRISRCKSNIKEVQSTLKKLNNFEVVE